MNGGDDETRTRDLLVFSTTGKSTDSSASHWKYIVGSIIVSRDVYRGGRRCGIRCSGLVPKGGCKVFGASRCWVPVWPEPNESEAYHHHNDSHDPDRYGPFQLVEHGRRVPIRRIQFDGGLVETDATRVCGTIQSQAT